MFDFDIDKMKVLLPKIKVIGIGGAGGNTVNSMIDSACEGIEFIAANTDAQALEFSKASNKMQLGIKSTKGLGTGANPALGKRAAEEDIDKVLEVVGDAEIVFVTGGMGGGTGSGALPVIAKALRDKGILTIAVVTRPFLFEGKRRQMVAEKAIEEVKKSVDTLIIIPNQKLLEITDQKVSMIDAFAMINNVLTQSVRGIADIITKPGHINVDFADVKTIMKDMGLAVMGTACAEGHERAAQAALEAITSPLLENMSIEGARGVLLNISGGPSLGLHEVSQAAQVIYEQADEHANIILGSVIDESLGDKVVVTVIATGFEKTIEKMDGIENVMVSGAQVTKEVAAEPAQKKSEIPSIESIIEKVPFVAYQLHKEAESLKKVPLAAVKIAAAEVEMEMASEPQVEKQDDMMLSSLDVNDLDVPTFMRKHESAQQD
jgi:cell division protein FtsZ